MGWTTCIKGTLHTKANYEGITDFSLFSLEAKKEIATVEKDLLISPKGPKVSQLRPPEQRGRFRAIEDLEHPHLCNPLTQHRRQQEPTEGHREA